MASICCAPFGLVTTAGQQHKEGKGLLKISDGTRPSSRTGLYLLMCHNCRMLSKDELTDHLFQVVGRKSCKVSDVVKHVEGRSSKRPGEMETQLFWGQRDGTVGTEPVSSSVENGSLGWTITVWVPAGKTSPSTLLACLVYQENRHQIASYVIIKWRSHRQPFQCVTPFRESAIIPDTAESLRLSLSTRVTCEEVLIFSFEIDFLKASNYKVLVRPFNTTVLKAVIFAGETYSLRKAEKICWWGEQLSRGWLESFCDHNDSGRQSLRDHLSDERSRDPLGGTCCLPN